ncbi:hypothetical protein DS745_21435 [Anaerobacillus alkaliphilus]|uniref:Uncharacterized protein n=1 Tax=Anaerobacillus alkaliphilus TaxID=1548597 RepID=A0A4Q0VMW0_9BACI|nr:hypothetical protein [Anaerobacillus alkaliphilus]RXI96296.1 hypothetical protein DS745_21435 [Anaerobacillus alkaliphilus]
MKFFVEAWSTKFQSDKYPLDFYRTNIEEIQTADTQDRVGELIINLLHWKDGKVRVDVNGSTQVGDKTYTLLPTKPNTYNEKKHKEILTSAAFYDWVKEVRALSSFDSDKVTDIAEKFQLYGKDTLVIPTFILHVINPVIFPLYDQHVERAKRALLAEDISFKSVELDINSYIGYQVFFSRLLEDFSDPTLHDVKKLDNALWSFGKSLKSKTVKKYKVKSRSIKTNYVPNEIFKLEVLKRLNGTDKSQAVVMKEVADEQNVVLSSSYYDYPGSHIYRWRKQLSR